MGKGKFADFEDRAIIMLSPLKISSREFKKLVAGLAQLFYDEYYQHQKDLRLKTRQLGNLEKTKEASCESV
jgi:hypothetical protein